MIRLSREPEPAKLKAKRSEWTAKFLEKRKNSPGTRPDHRQYGHRDVREALSRMSHDKCFYCERKLSDREKTVDHHVEVHIAPERSFDWLNLYLACHDCQDKLDHNQLACPDCVDPCGPLEPADHLYFEDEVCRFHDEHGEATIKKYKLNRLDLQLRRSRGLRTLHKRVLALLATNQRASPTGDRSISAMAAADHAYSLMFRDALHVLRQHFPESSEEA